MSGQKINPSIRNVMNLPELFLIVFVFSYGYTSSDQSDATKWSRIRTNGKLAASRECPLGFPKLVEQPVFMIPYHIIVGLGS